MCLFVGGRGAGHSNGSRSCACRKCLCRSGIDGRLSRGHGGRIGAHLGLLRPVVRSRLVPGQGGIRGSRRACCAPGHRRDHGIAAIDSIARRPSALGPAGGGDEPQLLPHVVGELLVEGGLHPPPRPFTVADAAFAEGPIAGPYDLRRVHHDPVAVIVVGHLEESASSSSPFSSSLRTATPPDGVHNVVNDAEAGQLAAPQRRLLLRRRRSFAAFCAAIVVIDIRGGLSGGGAQVRPEVALHERAETPIPDVVGRDGPRDDEDVGLGGDDAFASGGERGR
mmetsp:Transcript_25251/g.46926  ORF Transcript_25251/g.46926 Transcript_25251/m.46926 type:complete len:280 (+) Transcript_25251:922-1761(+)